jgi:hypothetical protein
MGLICRQCPSINKYQTEGSRKPGTLCKKTEYEKDIFTFCRVLFINVQQRLYIYQTGKQSREGRLETINAIIHPAPFYRSGSIRENATAGFALY